METDRALAALSSSPKYRGVYPGAVERIYSESLRRHGPKGADKAARAELHRITGAFLSPKELKLGLIYEDSAYGTSVAGHQEANAKEAGGLSGRPLFDLSTRMLAQTFLRVEGQFPIVGVGGVDSAETAFAKIEAGATLLQLYSALVFEGVGLVGRIKRGLVGRMAQEGLESLTPVVGRKAKDWAEKPV